MRLCPDCRRGYPCALCLALEHPDPARTSSIVRTENAIGEIPNFGGQEWAMAWARGARHHGMTALGFVCCADCGEYTKPNDLGTCTRCQNAASVAAQAIGRRVVGLDAEAFA